MPHASLKLIPGVDQNRTPALNEAAISESNLIRFVPDRQGLGLPQKLGGWTQFVSNEQSSVVRALHSWADINGEPYLAIGDEDSLNIATADGSSSEISPQFYTYNLPVSVDTVSGSATVTIDDTNSNISSYDGVNILTPISVGGIILSGYYPPIALNPNSYQVVARNIIGLTTPATATVNNSGAVPVFDTTSGQINIKVTLADHGYTAGSTFAILVGVNVGGLRLYGNYVVLDTPVLTANDFYIAADNAATSTATVSMNGGNARIVYYVGQQNISPPSGFGIGDFGSGGFGTGVTSSGGRELAIASISSASLVATVTVSQVLYVAPGTRIVITGTTNYNGTWIVTSATSGTSSTFSFVRGSNPATETSGTVTTNAWGFPPGVYSTVNRNVAAPLEVNDWSLDNWGGFLIANPAGSGVFYYDTLSGGDHANVIPNAPSVSEGCFVSMPERQIICYGTTFNGIQDPLLVRWTDIGNLTSWVATVSNQAGSFRIPKGSKIIGGMQGPQQGLLWTDTNLWSMQYINLPLVYSFNEIGAGCGLIGRKAMGTMTGIVYWMSQSQFFVLAGGGVQPLPCPVWDVIFQDLDTDYLSNIRCAPNSRFGEISWYYPTKNQDGTSSNGVPTKYVKYNTLLQQWDFGTLTRTAWIDQGVFGPPIGASDNGFIYQHETSQNADGGEMDAYVQTGYFALSEGDNMTFLDQVWPDMKWGYYNGLNNANVNITFYAVDYPGQTPRIYGPYNVNQATEYISPRIRARLISIKIAGSQIDTFWRLGNIRYRLQPDGKY
jgi:hypothetical protein